MGWVVWSVRASPYHRSARSPDHGSATAPGYDPGADTASPIQWLLWLGVAAAVLAVAVVSVGNVLLRGPRDSDVPIWGGALRAVGLVLAVLSIGLIGAWFITR
jgi:hypothetical protein